VATLREKLVAASALGASSSSRSAAEYEAAQQRLADMTDERDNLRTECDTMRVSVRDAERYREKNKELSREVDRLTVATASAGGAAGNTEFENRLARLQGEKEAMEGKLRAHQTHSAKVKETYQRLTTMYNQLRDENVDLQGRLDKLEHDKASSSSSVSERVPNAGGADASGTEIEALRTELRDAKQIARNVEASKDSLQRDHDRLTAQLGSMQDRLDQLTEEVQEVREEADALHTELAEITSQRDNAVKRAQASRAGDRGFDSSAAAASEARLAEAMAAREQAEREGVRIRQRVMELERELGDLTEDLEYEKAEKAKAREERDALRESARALEKRTSEASQAADAVHALKRQLSTHKMRDVDQSAMIADLREEVDRLQSELDDLRMRSSGAGGGSHGGSRSGADADVLETLVMTKLALATSEDEKLQLQFSMKTLRANEKAVQERLAAHASRLEVRLSEANDELERYRRRLSNADYS
jgi:chromosome segregation ATPase